MGRYRARTQASDAAKEVVAKVRAAADQGLYSAAIRLQAMIQTEIVPAESPPPIDQRAYVAAWGAAPEKIRNGWALKNSMPYAAVIDKGARAENIKVGRAMLEALATWAQRKGLVPQGRSTGALSEAMGVAWAIAKSMQKRGIFNRGGEGLRISEKAAHRAPPIVAEEVAREVAKVR